MALLEAPQRPFTDARASREHRLGDVLLHSITPKTVAQRGRYIRNWGFIHTGNIVTLIKHFKR